MSELARLVQKYKGEELSITLMGHSMGSALTILCAYDIAELELNHADHYSGTRIPVAVYSFASRRMGNTAFRDRCKELGLWILHVVNVHDVVAKIPGVIINENFRVTSIDPWRYAHVGVELALDHKLYYTQFSKPKDHHHHSYVQNLVTYLEILSCCYSNH